MTNLVIIYFTREASQEVLRREMDRYNDVLMHREELTQQDLQDRLYKIEEKLQVGISVGYSWVMFVTCSYCYFI